MQQQTSKSLMPSKMHLKLTMMLLRHGQGKLSEVWGIGTSEVSRKLNGETGIKLDQLADALEAIGADLVMGDESIVIPREEYEALKTLAKKGLSQ